MVPPSTDAGPNRTDHCALCARLGHAGATTCGGRRGRPGRTAGGGGGTPGDRAAADPLHDGGRRPGRRRVGEPLRARRRPRTAGTRARSAPEPDRTDAALVPPVRPLRLRPSHRPRRRRPHDRRGVLPRRTRGRRAVDRHGDLLLRRVPARRGGVAVRTTARTPLVRGRRQRAAAGRRLRQLAHVAGARPRCRRSSRPGRRSGTRRADTCHAVRHQPGMEAHPGPYPGSVLSSD